MTDHRLLKKMLLERQRRRDKPVPLLVNKPHKMASAPRLDGLPSEILLNITNNLSTAEVFDLRCVCRRLGEQLYPTMPTERIIIADSERQLQMLINMTEPGQPGYILKKLTLVETRPGYLPSEQCIEDGDLEWAEWTTKPLPESEVETSSQYEPSEGSSARDESDEEMEDDWVAENDVQGEDEDGDLTMEDLTTKYAPILKTSDDPTVDWETLWPPYFVPSYYDKDERHWSEKSGMPKDIEPDYGYPLGSWDGREKTWTGLLRHAFKNLRHNTKVKALEELDLKVASLKRGVEEREVDQKEPAVMLGELFHRVAVALHCTKIPIKKLKIGHAQYVLGCERLSQLLDNQCNHYTVNLDLKPSLCRLEELYIKFSYTEDEGTRWGGDSGAIIRFVQQMPFLKSLHIHGYNSWSTKGLPMLEQIVYSGAIVRESLKTCTLEGFGTELGELEIFLNKFNTLKSLTLRGLFLATDEYTKLFGIIEKELGELNYLHLDNLYEVESKEGDREDSGYLHKSLKGLVVFDGDEPNHYPPDRGPNFIKRTGALARTAIQISDNHRNSMDGVAFTRWQRRWVNNYGGWPWRSGKPSVGKVRSAVNDQLYLIRS